MHRDLERILLTREQIAEKVKEAAAWLDERFQASVLRNETGEAEHRREETGEEEPRRNETGLAELRQNDTGETEFRREKMGENVRPPLAISVLKGSVFFFCDLLLSMKTPVQPEFMAVSSYGNASMSTGAPKIVLDLASSVEGRDVILVEDIVDSGYTLLKMRELILGRGAKSFTVVTLLDKPSRRALPVKADFSCFEVGDEFIVGYGLDYAQNYRNLPYIGVLKREIYERKGK